MKKDTRSVLLSKVEDNEARKEREAIRELERLEMSKNQKRSGYAPKHRRQYENHS